MHADLPRVLELIGLGQGDDAYGGGREVFAASLASEPEKVKDWRRYEDLFCELDERAWCDLKSRAGPYVAKRDPTRGWQQFINTINEVYGYNILKVIGATDIQFISEFGKKISSPDLMAQINNEKILCEVKTVSISDIEAIRRRNYTVGDICNELNDGFLKKLKSACVRAEQQIAKCGIAYSRAMIVVVLNFDDMFHEYKQQHFAQIDEFVSGFEIGGCEIAFVNKRTAFHCNIGMKNAFLFNEQ